MNQKIQKVLLVDDDPAMNYVNEFFLKHYNFCQNVVIEQYPEDALAKMQKWSQSCPEELPQLILLDLNMPVLTGYQLANAMVERIPAEHLRNIQVYVLSSSEIGKESNTIIELPFVKGSLIKPLQIQDLEKIFNN
ncbi:MAG: response regulator [Cytophagales bacterium]|nr:MAG: response regulator [Cytophagales bacterium]